ncbi:MAG TPA: hypothetical protein PLJ88_11185, partial [Agitococcus sp.]|nr:hypothetical protein [Agitococcus sp.]
MDDSKEKFAEYVSSLPTGSVEKNKTLIGFLELIWDSLSGSSNQNTTANKLDRIENIFWSPPLLEFILERHGPTVNGSSRANLHYWRVNINDWSAEIYKTGKKQLTPMSRKYYASIDAEAVAQLLIQGKYKDPR